MLQNELKTSVKKSKKRVWRGNWSTGTFSWRGCKWQNARSWWGVRVWFEWGQTQLSKRIPKLKGFKNINRVEYKSVNLSQLNKLSEKIITIEVLVKAWLVRSNKILVKILWDWTIEKEITVKVNKISKSAQEKIEKAGWKVELIK